MAETVQWLEAEGFVLRASRGGPDESFGNVLFEFQRSQVRVAVVRDRNQWMIDIAPSDDSEAVGLHVLLSAMRGSEPKLGRKRPLGMPLAEQLPEGERWRVEAPVVIEWIVGGDRIPEIAAAHQQCRRVMREQFTSPPTTDTAH